MCNEVITTADERNAATSQRDVDQFMAHPTRHIVYISRDEQNVTTWTGQPMGRIVYRSKEHGNRGNRFRHYHMIGINGLRYYGRSQGGGMSMTIRSFKA